ISGSGKNGSPSIGIVAAQDAGLDSLHLQRAKAGQSRPRPSPDKVQRASDDNSEQQQDDEPTPSSPAWGLAINPQRCQLVLQVLHGIASTPREMNTPSIA